ncbi:MAG: hypothetical protein J6R20_07195 [Clostridia bacterium]|nr:hypothetical protein [Clostridia bacterium]
MKKFRIASMILLIISSFFTLDLLINVLGNVMPEMNDGLGLFGLTGRMIFGDSLWSYERFFEAFRISTGITFVLFAENIILAIISIIKGNKKLS